MKKVLVTGATGFVGSRVIPMLTKQGYDVTAIVRDATTCPAGITCIEADLHDADRMATIANDINGCDTVLHLAASIPLAVTDPIAEEERQSRQFDATERLLALLPTSIEHIVYASTLDVYGIPETLPITEDHPMHPVTEYGKTKVHEEALLETLRDDRTVTVLRFSQLYGPGEPMIKAIPRFMKAVTESDTLTILGDGSDLRDYVYVDDAAAALVQAVEKRCGGVINIATGRSRSIKNVAEVIINISGKMIAIDMQDRTKPKTDFVFDVARMHDMLGFQPSTTLEEGLQREYDWFTAHAA